MGAKVIQVIETDLERRGSGKDETCPIRIIRQYWSLDGELLAEVDPVVQPTAANVNRADIRSSEWPVDPYVHLTEASIR